MKKTGIGLGILLLVFMFGLGIAMSGCQDVFGPTATTTLPPATVTSTSTSTSTSTTLDITAPTVSYTIPDDLKTGVALNRNITATFSEKMDPATITPTTFTLINGALGPVTGDVTYEGTVATFIPASNLATDTTYEATITTGAKDLAGNALAAAKIWSFMTGTTTAEGPDPVNLGTAGNFVILSKSGISTTGTTTIVGDIGVSPAAATYITGFALVADSTNIFSTSSLVTGKVYASNYASPTPSNMTTAIGDMEIAFTDAAGRTNPTSTEVGGGNISGMTITPGLYKWSSGVLINSDIYLSGNTNDVWIFQIAQDLTLADNVTVHLSGSAQAKNVFWQVSGKTTLGTTSVMNGNILCQTKIDVHHGATLNGRALAQTAVTLDSNPITLP